MKRVAGDLLFLLALLSIGLAGCSGGNSFLLLTSVRFSTFLKRIGADLTAKYVGFKCADGYYESIDMPTALHPQTLLTLTYDGRVLPREYGFPMKVRMPTKLGYKNPKHITAIFVTNTYPGGYWEDQGYNWFGGS